jgi:hypothetical protein
MPTNRARFRSIFLLVAAVAAAAPLSAQLLTASEWKLKVSVDNAAIRLKPDINAPLASTAAKGTMLQSYEATGAWYRVLAASPADGTSVIGFIATSDVDVVEENSGGTPGFWPIPAEIFRGLGLGLRLIGGIGTISSADIDASQTGMAATTLDELVNSGYSLVGQDITPIHSGTVMGGEMTFDLSRRLAVGAAFTYTRAIRDNYYSFWRHPNDLFLNFNPLIQVFTYRLGMYYTLPLNPPFSLILSAGPALYHFKYRYLLNFSDPGVSFDEGLLQDVASNILGAHVGLALELALNERSAIFLEAMGRLARSSTITGTESVALSAGGISHPRIENSGDLYYYLDGPNAGTTVRSSAPSGPGDVRKAVFDFSGVDLLLGFRIKF